MQAEEHEELADQLDRETARLERESDRLEHEIVEVRDAWHAKQADGSVPGAVQPDPDSDSAGGKTPAAEDRAGDGKPADDSPRASGGGAD